MKATKVPEYHLWLGPPPQNVYAVTDYYSTCQLLHGGAKVVHSTCTTLFTTSMLDLGRRLFIHFPDGRTEEISYGNTTPCGRLIRPGLNLEKLILAGEFGKIA